METKFFLGANSPGGFNSLYSDFVDPERDRLNIIKSGPGSGKSTFMRLIAERAEGLGYDVELIKCSGDPDSLDGVYIPAKNTAYVDGTAPHIIEPVYSGSGDNYIDLSRFYDRDGVRSVHAEIMGLTADYKAEYQKAYMLIASAHSAETALKPSNSEYTDRALKRMSSVLAREIKSSGKRGGTVRRRYLNAVTCTGRIAFYETVPQLAERVFIIDSDAGLNKPVMAEIRKKAGNMGWDMILCLSPMDPGEILHIILPELSCAFVSSLSAEPYPYEGYRRIRLDSIPDSGFMRAVKESKKLPEAILNEAVKKLEKAKEYHDELEKVYNPFVDFDSVRALALNEADRLFG